MEKSGRNLNRARAGYKPKIMSIKQLAQYTLRYILHSDVYIHFPSVGLTYKSLTCSGKGVSNTTHVCEEKKTIFSTFIYGV
jgi:hypothetical protein